MSTKETWNVGDMCYLKSGSPRMTVTRLCPEDLLEVQWAVYETGELRTAHLPALAVRRYTENA